MDEDGFSIYLYYGPNHMMIQYENRKTRAELIDFLGVVDWKLEMMVFIGRIMQLFGHDLSEFERGMVEEIQLFLKHN